MYAGRMEVDASLVKVGNFRKYEVSFLRRGGGASEGSGVVPVSSKAKPPPPKAPIAYWRDQHVVKEEEKGKEKLPKALGQKGEIQKEDLHKAANPTEKNPNGNIPKERAPVGKIHRGRIR